MATSRRPYQGYPYVDPPVTDASSISADDAARWHHLPRRQVELNMSKDPDIPVFGPKKKDSNSAPVVYIDLPEASGSIVTDRQDTEDHNFEVVEPLSSRTNSKEELDVPVVYIDLPEASGSDVARSQEHLPQEEPAFYQGTIYYDPFENRRIDRAKNDESDDDSEVSGTNRIPIRRLNTLDLNGAGPSAGPSTSTYTSSAMSSLMSKEADLYGRTGDDGFPASPIPVSQFPEPPPAYTEIDVSPVVTTTPEPVVEQPPPRTEVILPREYAATTPIGVPNPNRKYLNCHHCGMRAHTLVVKENGNVTHVTAFLCLMIACIPAIALIYCTDCLKVKNHYCPNCNQIIAFEQPLNSNKIVYAS